MRNFNREDWFFVGAINVVALLIIAAIFATLSEGRAWADFAAENNCKVVAKEKATLLVGTDEKVMVGRGKTAYQCDDGVVYWR